MNLDKIGQFIGTICLLGAGLAWYRVDNWTIELSITLVVSGIFFLWAGTTLEEKIQTRKVLKKIRRESDVEFQKVSMMKIINKYSLDEPTDLTAGVLEISKFLINAISRDSDSNNKTDSAFAKGVFFLSIYDVVAVKYSTETSSKNSHNYLAGMLAMDSTVESPGTLLQEIMDYLHSNQLDLTTVHLISTWVSQFIDSPNQKFIDNLASKLQSFEK